MAETLGGGITGVRADPNVLSDVRDAGPGRTHQTAPAGCHPTPTVYRHPPDAT